MTTKSGTSLNEFYENQAVDSLPILLRECLRISVSMPDCGYSKIFRKAEFISKTVAPWPLSVEEAQVDFWSHAAFPSDSVVPISMATYNKNVFSIVDSSLGALDFSSRPPAGFRDAYPPSPEKVDEGSAPPVPQSHYVLGEVTCGGKESIKGKLKQLEKDTGIAMALCGTTEPDLAVVVAIVITNNSEAPVTLHNTLSGAPADYPNLRTLMSKGRLLHLYNPHDIVTVVAAHSATLEDFKNSMDASITDLGSTVEELRRGQEDLRRGQEEIIQVLRNLVNNR